MHGAIHFEKISEMYVWWENHPEEHARLLFKGVVRGETEELPEPLQWRSYHLAPEDPPEGNLPDGWEYTGEVRAPLVGDRWQSLADDGTTQRYACSTPNVVKANFQGRRRIVKKVEPERHNKLTLEEAKDLATAGRLVLVSCDRVVSPLTDWGSGLAAIDFETFWRDDRYKEKKDEPTVEERLENILKTWKKWDFERLRVVRVPSLCLTEYLEAFTALSDAIEAAKEEGS